jgi:Lon protease-like protein
VTVRLPLFPLTTVLYPGLVLPLNVFEARYRQLVKDLMDLPADTPRRFGVVGLRSGHEVGPPGPELPEPGPTTGFGSDDPRGALYPVGCIAEIASVQARDADAGYELVASGTTRFTLSSVDTSGPYLVAEVEELPEVTGADASALVPGVTAAFREYQRRLAATRERSVTSGQEMPEDPKVLSYLVAAASVLDIHRKQALLAAPSAAARLAEELRMLRRESAIIEQLPSLPAVELPRRTFYLN